jgi:hypothetical protein
MHRFTCSLNSMSHFRREFANMREQGCAQAHSAGCDARPVKDAPLFCSMCDGSPAGRTGAGGDRLQFVVGYRSMRYSYRRATHAILRDPCKRTCRSTVVTHPACMCGGLL